MVHGSHLTDTRITYTYDSVGSDISLNKYKVDCVRVRARAPNYDLIIEPKKGSREGPSSLNI